LIENTVYKPQSFIDRDFVLRDSQQVEVEQSFGDTLRGVLGQVNQLQIESTQATNDMLSGDLQNLHQVMIKAQEAQLSLQLTVQVVNKVLQAYQEVSRMQI
jgi:flagellar hook-basal body complex protein FliE